MKQVQLVILTILLQFPLLLIGQIPDGHFLDADDSAEKGYKIKPFEQREKGIYHYAVLDELPFENNCPMSGSQKEKIKCAEDTLNQLIIDNWVTPGNYKASSYVYITIDERGNPIDINVKSYPHIDEIESMYFEAIHRINFKPAKYNGQVVKARLWVPFEYE